jgi:serine/threonine protein phosphatase 1
MQCGGIAALDSYGETGRLDLIPDAHIRFLEKCAPYYETDTHLFLHANYNPELPLSQTNNHTLRWLSLREFVPGPHFTGKIALMGHTPQPDVLDLGHLICIDTNCCKQGWRTAIDMASQQKWQVDENGW